jgi:pimeloyl-ACP methyl ester carboxylesterase
VAGIHLTDVPFWHIFEKSGDLTAAERKFLERNERWQKEEGAYAMIQGTRPRSLAVGLDDSPAGLAAWMIEKYREWSDCGGDIERRFSKDDLITQVMIYCSSSTPAAFALFPADISSPPREWAERFFNVRRWTEMPAGGHFAAFEEPERLASDLREFFRPLRAA